jgi:hypothetical protein
MSLRRVSYSFLVLGGLGTLGLLIYAAQGFRSLISGFTVWALIPYAAFAIATRVARTRGSVVAACIASFVAAFFGLFIYVDALFFHISSTSSLVLVFIPLYQLLAALVVLVFALERRRHATQDF